jgi:ketosteroid isomerase-like protein
MLLLVSGAGALGEAPAVDVEKLESNWVAALLAANIHALEDMYSDDLI